MAEPVPRVGVGVLVCRGSKVLIGRRRSSIGDGSFALPGGHLDFGESWEECAAREVKEETGLSIHNIKFVFVTNTVMRDEKRPSHYITIFMRGEQCNAADEPENLEPNKCDGWEWVEWPNVPEPIFHPLKSLIDSNYELPQATDSGNSSSEGLLPLQVSKWDDKLNFGNQVPGYSDRIKLVKSLVRQDMLNL